MCDRAQLQARLPLPSSPPPNPITELILTLLSQVLYRQKSRLVLRALRTLGA